jgi:uncharacterized protein
VGPGKVLDALKAVEAVGIGRREDFYWTLHAVFVNRRDQHELFDQAFHIFWRDPKLLERMMAMLLPHAAGPARPRRRRGLSRRLPRPCAPRTAGRDRGEEIEPRSIEIDATMTHLLRKEVLQEMDFEKMSAAELEARQGGDPRHAAADHGGADAALPPRRPRIDMRATLRAPLRSGGDIIPLRWKKRRRRRRRRWSSSATSPAR